MSWGLCFPQGIHDYLHQQFWGIVAHKKGTAAWFSFMHFTVIQCSQLSSMCYCLINFCSADGRDSSLEFSCFIFAYVCIFYYLLLVQNIYEKHYYSCFPSWWPLVFSYSVPTLTWWIGWHWISFSHSRFPDNDSWWLWRSPDFTTTPMRFTFAVLNEMSWHLMDGKYNHFKNPRHWSTAAKLMTFSSASVVAAVCFVLKMVNSIIVNVSMLSLTLCAH